MGVKTKEMKVLSLEQMNKLERLGVDVSNASMCYISIYPYGDLSDGIVPVSKDFNKNIYNEFGDVFTLQDMIELLPKSIIINSVKHWVCVSPNCLLTEFQIMYVDGDNSYSVMKQNKSLLEAAYEMLLWVIEKGYLKTK